MTLKELAKFAPKVYKIVNAMAKNRSVVSFQVVVPSQKLPSRKKGTGVVKKPTAAKGAVVNKGTAKPSKPVAAKKAKPKSKKRKA